ncbi:MAG: 4a-hydroxytetrahydrobiopterin dehydratase [Actinobacteria bacterium]|nr:4a-hydroxytetrahydrobiopterin dehydratase [Actinomycetota bacterium]
MGRPVALSGHELADAVASLPGWEVRDGRLHRELRFADFSRAFGFMAAAAVVAQGMDHHPDWSNSYATVTVDLTTHDAGGVTVLDVELARRMSELAVQLGAPLPGHET